MELLVWLKVGGNFAAFAHGHARRGAAFRSTTMQPGSSTCYWQIAALPYILATDAVAYRKERETIYIRVANWAAKIKRAKKIISRLGDCIIIILLYTMIIPKCVYACFISHL